MNVKARKVIGNDIANAANTCNQVVSMMQMDDIVNSKAGMTSAMVMALVGINQALVAIAETIACGQDDPDEEDAS